MGPNSGKAVGLKFHQDAQLLLRTRVALLSHPQFSFNTQNVLHVMANLMSDDVGLGKISWRAKLALQFVVEIQIDVDALVGRAIEGTHCGFSVAATAAH